MRKGLIRFEYMSELLAAAFNFHPDDWKFVEGKLCAIAPSGTQLMVWLVGGFESPWEVKAGAKFVSNEGGTTSVACQTDSDKVLISDVIAKLKQYEQNRKK